MKRVIVIYCIMQVSEWEKVRISLRKKKGEYKPPYNLCIWILPALEVVGNDLIRIQEDQLSNHFFFFEMEPLYLPHLLIMERIQFVLQDPLLQNNHSRAIVIPSFFAPMVTQSLASSLMMLRSTSEGAPLCQNTCAFFHTVQVMSIVRDAIAFLLATLLGGEANPPFWWVQFM